MEVNKEGIKYYTTIVVCELFNGWQFDSKFKFIKCSSSVKLLRVKEVSQAKNYKCLENEYVNLYGRGIYLKRWASIMLGNVTESVRGPFIVEGTYTFEK